MSNSTKTNRAFGNTRDTGTQTHDSDTMLDIERLQEQVNLLTLEIDRLRKHSPGEPSVATESTPRSVRIRAKQTSHNIQLTPKGNNSIIIRGCSCKGQCDSKKCGCVKKNASCGELCKCKSSVCQNQERNGEEQNKENLENIEVAPVAAKKINNKNLVNVAPHKSLFSPDTTIVSSTPTLAECILSPVEFRNPKKLFMSDPEEGTSPQKKNSKNPISQKRGRRKKNLEVDSDKTKHLSWEKEIQKNDHANSNGRGADLKKDVEEEDPKPTGYQEKEMHTQTLDDSFNPMKPKYELPRTPTNGKSLVESKTNPSSSIPTPNMMQKEEELQVPGESYQAEVNWEEYQAQLVACNKCSRKFHPSRIQRHQACCKKV
ncbi:uncharacterized protein LOC143353308 [Halictus rubicundus]|uniref:uncharacterized protein LOC143353308 n=1 Tax=Halictus rubicundus TaxID=77578 RepID=UPI00403738A8